MKTTPAKRAVFKPPVLHGFHAAANSPRYFQFYLVKFLYHVAPLPEGIVGGEGNAVRIIFFPFFD